MGSQNKFILELLEFALSFFFVFWNKLSADKVDLHGDTMGSCICLSPPWRQEYALPYSFRMSSCCVEVSPLVYTSLLCSFSDSSPHPPGHFHCVLDCYQTSMLHELPASAPVCAHLSVIGPSNTKLPILSWLLH